MSYYDMVYGTNMFGDPTTSYFTAINGTAPIVVTTVGNTATVSHAASGVLPGTYNYGGFTVNSSGHITAATFGPVPLYSVDVKDENVAVVSTSTLNFAGAGVTVTNSPAGTALITIPAAAATTQGVVYGLTGGTATSNAGIGYNISFGAATQDTIVGSGSSTTGSGGLNAILGCTSTTASQYTQIHGTGVTVGSSANFCNIHGSGTTVANNCNSSNGLGYAQTFGHANCVLLGDGASTSAANELATGSQTRLRFPSLTATAASTASTPTTFSMLWDNSTKVCVPNTMPSTGSVSWTPTLSGGSSVGNGTLTGTYCRAGNLITAFVTLTGGTTMSIAASATISLPKTIANITATAFPVGCGFSGNATTAVFDSTVLVKPSTSSTLSIFIDDPSFGLGDWSAYTWSTNSSINYVYTYITNTA